MMRTSCSGEHAVAKLEQGQLRSFPVRDNSTPENEQRVTCVIEPPHDTIRTLRNRTLRGHALRPAGMARQAHQSRA
eukprot:9470632-Pyramimonas_sp.AAC.2